MDWKTYYQERHLTADEAVKHIKSGNRVLVGHACGEPSFLLDTMIGHKEDYENVELSTWSRWANVNTASRVWKSIFITMHILLEHAPVMLSTAVAEISRLASFIRSLKLSIPLCRWM